MAKRSKPCTILMADDDADDCLLVRDALRETHLDCNLRFVRDGEELSDYLYHRGKYANGRDAPRPDLILLDLRMPKKDGREVLGELKADPQLRRIPVVALTTSAAVEDIGSSYDIGVNSYLTKPATFRALVDMMKTLGAYWFELVELPPAG
jgi:CheY-like chemotaxis protein